MRQKARAMEQAEVSKRRGYLLSGKLAHRVYEARERRSREGHSSSEGSYAGARPKTRAIVDQYSNMANVDPYRWERWAMDREASAVSGLLQVDASWRMMDFAAIVDAPLRIPRKPEARRPC